MTYFVGLIDMLQTYDTRKQVERGLKLMRGQRAQGISSMSSARYASRFLDFTCDTLVTCHEAPAATALAAAEPSAAPPPPPS